jgi:hypothetical protein
MESIDQLVKTLLEDETKNRSGIETIKKIIKNILQNPHEQKFRRLKLSGKVFSEKLLPIEGAIPLLYALGFEESADSEFLELPEPNINIKQDLRYALNKIDRIESERTVAQSQDLVTQSERTNVQDYPLFQRQLQIKKITDSSLHHVVQWESEACRSKVRETIPVTDLYKRASDLYNDLTEEFKADDTNTKADYLRHSLLIVLSDWFKNEFFKWRDGHFTRHNDPLILLGNLHLMTSFKV